MDKYLGVTVGDIDIVTIGIVGVTNGDTNHLSVSLDGVTINVTRGIGVTNGDTNIFTKEGEMVNFFLGFEVINSVLETIGPTTI